MGLRKLSVVGTFVVLAMLPATSVAASDIVVVSPNNMHGWAFFNDHGPYLDFVKQYASQEEVHCASLRFQSTHRNN